MACCCGPTSCNDALNANAPASITITTSGFSFSYYNDSTTANLQPTGSQSSRPYLGIEKYAGRLVYPSGYWIDYYYYADALLVCTGTSCTPPIIRYFWSVGMRVRFVDSSGQNWQSGAIGTIPFQGATCADFAGLPDSPCGGISGTISSGTGFNFISGTATVSC
jgi:hypothetical protein